MQYVHAVLASIGTFAALFPLFVLLTNQFVDRIAKRCDEKDGECFEIDGEYDYCDKHRMLHKYILLVLFCVSLNLAVYEYHLLLNSI